MSDAATSTTPATAPTPDLALLSDERGSRSSMRVLLFCVVTPTLVAMTALEAVGHPLQNVVWATWSSIAGMLIIGCFGPRIAQYLAPQLGTLVDKISAARRDVLERRAKGGDFEVTP
jgi:hypothetical protein